MKKLKAFLSMLFVFIMVLITISCVSLRKEVSVVTDEFEPFITINGIEDYIGDDLKGAFFLRSFINKKTKDVTHQLYIYCTYHWNWRFYNSAHLSGGKALEFTEIRRDFNCTDGICTYYEHFGADISDEFLRKNTEGFSVKISAKSGDNAVINVKSNQVIEQLKEIDKLK